MPDLHLKVMPMPKLNFRQKILLYFIFISAILIFFDIVITMYAFAGANGLFVFTFLLTGAFIWLWYEYFWHKKRGFKHMKSKKNILGKQPFEDEV